MTSLLCVQVEELGFVPREIAAKRTDILLQATDIVRPSRGERRIFAGKREHAALQGGSGEFPLFVLA